jgi:hypothetical protein
MPVPHRVGRHLPNLLEFPRRADHAHGTKANRGSMTGIVNAAAYER